MAARERIGSYELLFLLARGGMGSVHLARHVGAAGFERVVVVKRIHPHLTGEPGWRTMLIDEARLSALIRHANVVPALDVVEDEGELALVLEYVESVSLSQLMRAASRAQEPLTPAIVARITSDALAGLHAAHEARDLSGRSLAIVHRDVSPQNILVGVDGVSRLIDFGVAKAAERVSITQSGVLKGKLRYMSPEQARHKEIDRRSDVFSAGAVLYEALCGRPAFRGETEASILLELLAGEVSQPTQVDGTELDPVAAEVLTRALATRPEDRYGTAAELQRALVNAVPPATAAEVGEVVTRLAGEALDKQRTELAKVLAGGEASVEPFADDIERTEHAAPPTSLAVHPRRKVVGVVVGGGLLICAMLALALVRRSSDADEAARSSTGSNAPALPPSNRPPPPPSATTVPNEPEPQAASSVPGASSAHAPDAGRAGAPRKHIATPPARPILHSNPYP
jgi:eukaryotic-like serine/threonine-protein kinase